MNTGSVQGLRPSLTGFCEPTQLHLQEEQGGQREQENGDKHAGGAPALRPGLLEAEATIAELQGRVGELQRASDLAMDEAGTAQQAQAEAMDSLGRRLEHVEAARDSAMEEQASLQRRLEEATQAREEGGGASGSELLEAEATIAELQGRLGELQCASDLAAAEAETAKDAALSEAREAQRTQASTIIQLRRQVEQVRAM